MPAIAKLIVVAGLVLMLVTGYRAMVCKYHWTATLPRDTLPGALALQISRSLSLGWLRTSVVHIHLLLQIEKT